MPSHAWWVVAVCVAGVGFPAASDAFARSLDFAGADSAAASAVCEWSPQAPSDGGMVEEDDVDQPELFAFELGLGPQIKPALPRVGNKASLLRVAGAPD